MAAPQTFGPTYFSIRAVCVCRFLRVLRHQRPRGGTADQTRTKRAIIIRNHQQPWCCGHSGQCSIQVHTVNTNAPAAAPGRRRKARCRSPSTIIRPRSAGTPRNHDAQKTAQLHRAQTEYALCTAPHQPADTSPSPHATHHHQPSLPAYAVDRKSVV